MPLNVICDPELRDTLIEQVVTKLHPQTKRPLVFFTEEIQWMLSHGYCENEQDYIDSERIGRTGTRLARKSRPAMFRILQEYLTLRQQYGKLYDWDDIALHCRRELEKDSSPRVYKHIIVDEGQDFSPEMLRSLALAVPEDGSLTFFGDVAQQIYGQRTSWRSAGLKISKQWEFVENHRNTKQIAKLGLAISNEPYFQGIADLVEPVAPNADGALPTIVKCRDNAEQIDTTLNVARNMAQTSSVAILVKSWAQSNIFLNNLGSSVTKLDRSMNEWLGGNGIYCGTYHSAKGLEFDMVILPYMESTNIPDQDYSDSHGEENAYTYYGKLLYVATTRARTNLLLLYSDELTSLLPKDKRLYN